MRSVYEDVEKLEPLCTLWHYKKVQLLWKTVRKFLKQLKIELPYNPIIITIPLVSIYLYIYLYVYIYILVYIYIQ